MKQLGLAWHTGCEEKAKEKDANTFERFDWISVRAWLGAAGGGVGG
jgi:hypothetical protein